MIQFGYQRLFEGTETGMDGNGLKLEKFGPLDKMHLISLL